MPNYDSSKYMMAAEEAARCLLCHEAPCSRACPAGIDPARFIQALRFRNFKGGAKNIRENNVFGGVCAKLCEASRYCQSACIRKKLDRPVDIPGLQAFLVDYEWENNMKILKPLPSNGKSAAILGAGIAAVTCGAQLALAGFKVKIYALGEVAGKALLKEAAQGRIDKGIIEKELELVKELGVEFIPHVNLETVADREEFRESGFDALVITARSAVNTVQSMSGKTPVFFSGDLIIGPDDYVYSVKKGKLTAGQIIKLVGPKEEAV